MKGALLLMAGREEADGFLRCQRARSNDVGKGGEKKESLLLLRGKKRAVGRFLQ